MAYVPVPKDLTKVKTKVAFNLTKRQLVCFTGGALLGVPLFFLLRGSAGNSTAALCMMFVMLPFFMLAMYEKHGQPLEKIVGNIIRVTVIRPRQRPYRTNISMVIALLGVAVLLTCSLQNGIILLVMAFLISPYGLPMAAIWLLGKMQDLKFAIQDLVYG